MSALSTSFWAVCECADTRVPGAPTAFLNCGVEYVRSRLHRCRDRVACWGWRTSQTGWRALRGVVSGNALGRREAPHQTERRLSAVRTSEERLRLAQSRLRRCGLGGF
jgi:hypothetical protein